LQGLYKTALNVVETYDVLTFTGLDTIYNFRVWANLENNRSLEIGVKKICFTLVGRGEGRGAAVTYNKQRLLVISLFK